MPGDVDAKANNKKGLLAQIKSGTRLRSVRRAFNRKNKKDQLEEDINNMQTMSISESYSADRVVPLDRGPAMNRSRSFAGNRRSIVGRLNIMQKEAPEMPSSQGRQHKVVKAERLGHFDIKTRNMLNLPKEWQEQLQKQFGLPPNLLENQKLPDYTSPIPSTLIMMNKYLIEHGGLDMKGIFRLAPDAIESDLVKSQIDQGTFVECKDVNCISNCIKIWFRDLPRPLLASVNDDHILKCRTDEDITRILEEMEEPYGSILLWLLDMCGRVCANSDVNLMSYQNMAIVMTPNLYKMPEITPGMDPMKAMKVMKLCKKFTEFFAKAIPYRLKHRVTKVETKQLVAESSSAPRRLSRTFSSLK